MRGEEGERKGVKGIHREEGSWAPGKMMIRGLLGCEVGEGEMVMWREWVPMETRLGVWGEILASLFGDLGGFGEVEEDIDDTSWFEVFIQGELV